VRWSEYLTRTGDVANAYRILVGNARERDRLRDLRMKGGGGVILKYILKRMCMDRGFQKVYYLTILSAAKIGPCM
jgi:hypothetical protein